MSNRTVNRYDPMPSTRAHVQVSTRSTPPPVDQECALAVPVAQDAEPARELDLDAAALRSAGFTGGRGQTLVLPGRDGILRVAVGVGSAAKVDRTLVREAAAEFARAVPQHKCLVVELPDTDLGISTDDYAQAVTEGVLLARWRFSVASDPEPTLESLILVGSAEDLAAAEEGAGRGQAIAEAYNIGRDLANCPAATLTAARMAELAIELGERGGFAVEVFDKDQLIEMGCGGILGVNMGSVDPPRLIRLRYVPENPTGRLALIGKGVMYDSGGISLKPSDESHAQMKNDMTGAAAILGAMTALRVLGCPTAVTAYLCCTDNMPSGSAMKLGDVLTMRNGTTVEVLNTDAEGRLVMADGLALAVEEPVDAVVDIATLTGACLRTFGVEIAGVMGNDPQLIGQLRQAGELADEPVWELPLHRPYRRQLDSAIADMTNMGGPNAGSITAALFLEEFVDGHPWAHIDIAGTAQLPAPRAWRNKGATGAGGMLLIELAMSFRPPSAKPTSRSSSS
jgi:leucyl aminopeptidase